jgi:hypothetical protein
VGKRIFENIGITALYINSCEARLVELDFRLTAPLTSGLTILSFATILEFTAFAALRSAARCEFRH